LKRDVSRFVQREEPGAAYKEWTPHAVHEEHAAHEDEARLGKSGLPKVRPVTAEHAQAAESAHEDEARLGKSPDLPKCARSSHRWNLFDFAAISVRLISLA
jgi:hypothetical protein